MKNFELSAYGVEELNRTETMMVEGGNPAWGYLLDVIFSALVSITIDRATQPAPAPVARPTNSITKREYGRVDSLSNGTVIRRDSTVTTVTTFH